MSDAATAPLLRRGTNTTLESEAGQIEEGKPLDPPKAQPSDEKATTENNQSVDEHPTQWRGLVVCGLIMFLTTSMGQTLAVAGWPYLRTIDPDVSVSFMGIVQALTRFGNAAGCCVFAVHAYTKKTFKKALIIGRIISLVGCIFYIMIELFSPTTRRWAFMLKFVLQSVAEGSLIVVRSYVPRMSREEDRPRAFAIVEGANMLAVVSGPVVQLVCNVAFSPQSSGLLGQEWLKFNMYTVPIWISLVLNLVTLFISMFYFEDPSLREMEGETRLPLGRMRKAWQQIKQLDKYLVALCFIEKGCSSIGFATMYTLMSPYVTETFNVSEDESLRILSIGQSAAGCISLAVVALFVFSPLLKFAKARFLFPFGLTCYLLMYLISYPVPGISEEIPLRNNVTTPYGCDAERYTWCGDGLKITNRYYWLASCSFLFGVGIPVSLTAFDTIYASVLGEIDQNIMQGALIIVDDLALVGAPVASAKAFDVFGPSPMWLSVAGICVCGLFLWLPFLPKFKKHNI